MKTDSIFYRIFQTFPQSFFDLLNLPPDTINYYQFSSVFNYQNNISVKWREMVKIFMEFVAIIIVENTNIILMFLFFISVFRPINYINYVHAETIPQEEKTGWSEWKTWKNFPHAQIQLGFSNSDYGGMMDLE